MTASELPTLCADGDARDRAMATGHGQVGIELLRKEETQHLSRSGLVEDDLARDVQQRSPAQGAVEGSGGVQIGGGNGDEVHLLSHRPKFRVGCRRFVYYRTCVRCTVARAAGLAEVDDAHLVEAIGGWARVEAAAAARRLAAIGQLVARRTRGADAVKAIRN